MITWIRAALLDWAVVVFAYCLAFHSLWLIPFAMLIIGNRQHAIGILGHDGAHQLIIPRSRYWNDWVANCFAFYPLGLSLREYRKFHWDHHRNVNTDRDPEVILKKTAPNPMVGPVSLTKVILHGAMDLLGFGVPHVARFLHYIRPKSVRDAIPIAVLGLVSSVLLCGPLYLIPVLWFGSLLTTFWFFFRLRVWTEHVGLGENETLQFTPSWWQVVLFLPHNTWLHHEHHSNPGMPFYRLPDVRTESFPSLISKLT